MNKGLISFLSIFFALIVGALYFSKTIQSPVISTLNYIKSSYNNTTASITDTIYRYTFQANHIHELKQKLKKYEKDHLIMRQMASEINDYYKLNNTKLKNTPKVELVRAISYEKFGDTNRIWMDIKDYNRSKIYGLTFNEFVAGIVINKNDKPLGVLNKDFQSSYAVYVGDEKAPGIVNGNNGENLIVRFIPAWFKIKVGDEVISSGLDNIFFKGLKVGKILNIKTSQGYQSAEIKPYYNSKEPNYFYMIRSVK
ncbi:MAG: rod shape-determining protein MreC [Epsilonproteobacteria bacterium]|nr:rod shape-determining protein MreC [Campylobacterota bacterium]